MNKKALLLAGALVVFGTLFPKAFVIDLSQISISNPFGQKVDKDEKTPAAPEVLDPRATAPNKYDFRVNIAASGMTAIDRETLSAVLVSCVQCLRTDQARGESRAILDTTQVMSVLQNSIAYRYGGVRIDAKFPGVTPLVTQLNNILAAGSEAETLGIGDEVAQRVIAAFLDLAAQLVETPKPVA